MPLPLDPLALRAAYADGLSPAEVVGAAYDRFDAAGDPAIFISALTRAEALAKAQALPRFDPQRLPLWGVPCAVKDNIDVAGFATTAGCPAFTYRPEASAPAVARLEAAGAIVLGKTNLDQFATGLVGVRSPHGAPRNAFAEGRVPGGSSSGSAVSVARGIVGFALGTDTAGSGRVPAALNNVLGLKPSLGAISTRGVVPACRSLDCVSIFAATVADARLVFEVVTGFDAADPFSRPLEPLERDMSVIGVPRPADLRFFGDRLAAEAWDAARAELAKLAPLVEIDMMPFFAAARLLYDGPWVAERRVAVGRLLDDAPEAIDPAVRGIVASADRFSAADLFRAQYELRALARETEAVWGQVGALAVPSAPVFPTLAEVAADPLGPNARLGTYTNFVNLLDLCTIAAPGPFRADGLPAGVTFVAPRDADHALAGLAERFFPGRGGVAAPGAMKAA